MTFNVDVVELSNGHKTPVNIPFSIKSCQTFTNGGDKTSSFSKSGPFGNSRDHWQSDDFVNKIVYEFTGNIKSDGEIPKINNRIYIYI